MTNQVQYREMLPAEFAALETLYPAAFPDEDLLPVLRALGEEESGVISLVGAINGEIVAHVAFTICGVEGKQARVALLAPLAVAPDRQRQGIGGAIVRAGFGHLEKAGISRVQVLGDPAYYGRFGFEADDDIEPPYPLPKEWQGAWQTLNLGIGEAGVSGKLSVPKPWQDESMWS